MAFDFQRRGILCVVSGPSGSGKTTLCRSLSDSDPSCVYAISCTTRRPRTGETDGQDYTFLTRKSFEERALRGEFLEWAEVHGNLYGTLKSAVLDHIRTGKDVLIDIDVQGAGLIRKNSDSVITASYVDIFILPPNREELVKRLGGRGTEDESELTLRLENALEEMRHWPDYDYAIVSGSPEEDLTRFRSIVQSERCRSSRLCPVETQESQPDLFS